MEDETSAASNPAPDTQAPTKTDDDDSTVTDSTADKPREADAEPMDQSVTSESRDDTASVADSLDNSLVMDIGSPETSSKPRTDVQKRKDVDPRWLMPFRDGWRREIVFRNTYDEKKSRSCDVYYYTPNKGPKLRSCVQIGKYLDTLAQTDLTTDCFTFIKNRIHEDPQEFVRSAGKSTFGRPKPGGSPAKSTPKTPVMKQKKSPFVKSPLTLKKTAMGLSPSPTSPKTSPMIIRLGGLAPKITSPGGDKKVFVVKKNYEGSGALSQMNIVTKSSPVNIKPLGATPTYIIKNTMETSVTKAAVAKKHTGKRSGPVMAGLAKKVKVDQPFSGVSGQRLCGMECPGRMGIPPSLNCTTCMCMFHPECVGISGQQRLDGFVCKACKSHNKSLQPSSTIVTHRPGQSGPPPLRPAPALSGPGSRQPPPLRMARPATNIVNPLAPPPLRVQGGAINIRPTPIVSMATSSNIPLPVMESSPVSILPTATNGIHTINNLAGVTSVVVQPPPTLLPTVIPAPPTISLPSTPVTKEASGQILALPSNVTSKINMDKPVSLKVNGQRFVIPPHCFINTKEGAKIYLPVGFLPTDTVQGAGAPLSIDLNTQANQDEQLLNITPYKDAAAAAGERETPSPTDATATRTSARKPRRLPKNYCHIQQLHVGFNCLFGIFQYLGLKDLLRASQVCQTWRRVSSQTCMWRRVVLRGCVITDWEKAGETLLDRRTRVLDLRAVTHPKDASHTWSEFTLALPSLAHLRRLDFGQCPTAVLHAVAGKVAGLRELTAEFISDAQNADQVWSTNAKLDIGKFSALKDLEVLTLRAISGLSLPAFSFSGGLQELSSLTKLRRLSLTTLREVPEEEFNFLSSLTNLEELELGDISSWKQETYQLLGGLTKLQSLRLECGQDGKEGGLGTALQGLDKLRNLELIKFATSTSLMTNLPKVKTLKTLSIWPDTENNAAHVNTCTLNTVSEMSSVSQLDWGIMIDSTPTTHNGDSDSDGSSPGPAAARDGVPILPPTADLWGLGRHEGEPPEGEPREAGQEGEPPEPEYLSISQLVDRLGNSLPDTKIRVFKVPVVSPKTKAQSAVGSS